MAWSTREIADLAGTTQKAVRYYHAIGLLDEPDRGFNGYKQYQVPHLLRLIQITTLAELGMPLSRIAEVGDGGADELIDELDAAIARLQRNRERLVLLRSHGVSWQVPADLAEVIDGVAEADRGVVAIAARVLGDDAVAGLHEVLEQRDTTDEELDALPEDASDADIEDLAQRLHRALLGSGPAFPAVMPAGQGGPVPAHLAQDAIAEAFLELYRPVQLRVLVRLAKLVQAGEEAPGHAGNASRKR
ncbi:MerR family transcriptional regulator [Streptosporangium sp. NPDC006013]|uniref:MerR family transcriptional regulator n=1 Tax=Streptosporangium sp. NPDC006013 TaxID=3155596 RepID=UPI0033B19E24